MSDEVDLAESVAELAKKTGLKNYLWLYFLIVPLAASTASAVAIIIAALQGLRDHELSAQIYAKTLVIGFKSIVSIGAAYLTGLFLALFSSFVVSRSASSMRSEQRRARAELARYRKSHPNRDDDEVPGDLGEYQFILGLQVQAQERRQQVMVAAAVAYSSMLLVAAWFWLLQEDALELWTLISSIADGTTVTVTAAPGAGATELAQ